MTYHKKRKRDGLRLTDKKHPRQGIWSTIMGGLSILFFGGLCLASGQAGGQAGIGVGILGILCVVWNLWGFILAWLSLKMENIRQLFPSIGIVINGLMILLYLVVYILGTA